MTPILMGVINVTPDSFSDGGNFVYAEAAIEQAQKLVDGGASILDIGGESTRPGAESVPAHEEIKRVIPVVESLVRRFPDVVVSVDTSKSEVMRAAIEAGATLINDVMALSQPQAVEIIAQSQVGVCLMHMQGEPRTMQHAPHYVNVVDEVAGYLKARLQMCLDAGIELNRIAVDPGFGFGKTLQHNLQLMAHLGRFEELGAPILVGVSRKSMIGQVIDKPVDQRLMGSVAAALIAAQNGAKILRVHDVDETRDALRIWQAVSQSL